jgi:hypothetical protein
VARAEQRVADMQAERDSLSRLRRPRRAAIEHEIEQQRAAIERWATLADEVISTVPLRPPEPEPELAAAGTVTVTRRGRRCSTRAAS